MLVADAGAAPSLKEELASDGLAVNLLAFNVGVQLGQVAALSVMVLLFALWRSPRGFARAVLPANTVLIAVGLLLFGYQLAGYLQGH